MSTLNRLNKARKSAEGHTEGSHYSNWRNWITRKVEPQHVWRDPSNPDLLYCDNLDALGWRVVGESHKINSWIKHTGWYSDNHQGGLYIGVVLQLPSRDGIEQFVPAIRHSEWDTATVYLNERTPEKRDAANWADQNAEREAEESREFDAKDSAEQQIAEARSEIHRINKEVLPALKDIKGQKFSQPVCSMIRDGILEHLADRRNAFNQIKKLQDDFWQAVPQ